MRNQFRAEPEEREQIIRTISGLLAGEPDIEFAWLYGSFLAADRFRDIDVGVYLNATPDESFQRGLDLAARLDEETTFPIDVRVLNDTPVTFLFHVFREGRLLITRNEEAMADVMEKTVREYLDKAPLLRRATIEAYGT